MIDPSDPRTCRVAAPRRRIRGPAEAPEDPLSRRGAGGSDPHYKMVGSLQQDGRVRDLGRSDPCHKMLGSESQGGPIHNRVVSAPRAGRICATRR